MCWKLEDEHTFEGFVPRVENILGGVAGSYRRSCRLARSLVNDANAFHTKLICILNTKMHKNQNMSRGIY